MVRYNCKKKMLKKIWIKALIVWKKFARKNVAILTKLGEKLFSFYFLTESRPFNRDDLHAT